VNTAYLIKRIAELSAELTAVKAAMQALELRLDSVETRRKKNAQAD